MAISGSLLIALLISDLVLDAMDSSGEQHLQMDHNIFKKRLDLSGKEIGLPTKHEITITTTVNIVSIYKTNM